MRAIALNIHTYIHTDRQTDRHQNHTHTHAYALHTYATCMYAPMRLHMPASGSAVMSNLQELDIMGDLGLLASTHPHASA